jgi:hypothetical protein
MNDKKLKQLAKGALIFMIILIVVLNQLGTFNIG